MIKNCCDNEDKLAHYRVVNTIAERNLIPCAERVLGMIVTVVQDNYKQYMLQGNDACNNNNWKPYNEIEQIKIHKTIDNAPSDLITSDYLNTQFPNTPEGFKVTYKSLNSSFMRIANGEWLITNYTPI